MLIKFDPQAWCLWNLQVSAFSSDFLASNEFTKIRILLRHELRNQGIRYRIEPVEGGGNIDVGGKPMIGHNSSVIGSQRRDLHGFGESTAAGQVYLYNVDLPLFDEAPVGLTPALFLARCDTDFGGCGEPPIALVIVRSQRFLKPVDFVLRK